MCKNESMSLKEYVDIKFNASQIATDKAEHSLNVRLEAMNEFRSAISDQQTTFVTRAEFSVVQKMVYIGFGGLLAIEILLKYIK